MRDWRWGISIFRVSHIFHPLLCHSPSLYACSLKNSSKTHKFARSSLFSWFSRGGTRSLDLINCFFFTFFCHVYATIWRCLQRFFFLILTAFYDCPACFSWARFTAEWLICDKRDVFALWHWLACFHIEVFAISNLKEVFKFFLYITSF